MSLQQKVDKRRSDNKTMPWSIGIKQSEFDELNALAEKHGVTRNALGVWFIRHCLKEIKAGRLKLPVTKTTTNTLKNP
jgi:ribosomal protein L37AE/L43A